MIILVQTGPGGNHEGDGEGGVPAKNGIQDGACWDDGWNSSYVMCGILNHVHTISVMSIIGYFQI